MHVQVSNLIAKIINVAADRILLGRMCGNVSGGRHGVETTKWVRWDWMGWEGRTVAIGTLLTTSCVAGLMTCDDKVRSFQCLMMDAACRQSQDTVQRGVPGMLLHQVARISTEPGNFLPFRACFCTMQEMFPDVAFGGKHLASTAAAGMILSVRIRVCTRCEKGDDLRGWGQTGT